MTELNTPEPIFTISGDTKIKETFRKQTGDSKFLQFAKKKNDSGVFNDVVLCVGTEKLPTNKLILSYHSVVFDELLESRDRNLGCYPIHFTIACTNQATMKHLTEYFYSDSIVIDADNVCELLSASVHLRIDDVREFCFKFLTKATNYSNCFDIYGIAVHYKNKILEDHVIKFVEKNFDEVTSSAEFKDVKLQDLLTCLPKLNRNHVQEVRIYEAILSWTKHDKKNRSKDFLKFFQHLDLNRLPSQHLLDVAQEENLFQEDSALTKSFNEIYKVCLKRVKAKTTCTRILSLGGRKTETEVFIIFDHLKNHSEDQYPDLPEGRCGGFSVASNNSVWYFGGKDGSGKAHKDVWRLKLQQKELKWKHADSMKEERALMAGAIFQQSLIVTGGASGKGNKILHSCEYFNEVSSKWQKTTSLKSRRSGHALVACKDALYAFGGYDGKTVLSSVERLTTIDGEWENVCSMKTPRCDFTAVNCNDVIYAIGGSDSEKEKTSLKSAEKYDVKTNMWIYLSEMNHARSGCSSCVFQGRIFAVGGVDAEGRVVKEIEIFDPLIDKWNIAGRTEQELISSSTVAI